MKLQKMRLDRGLSQSQLAEKTGINVRTIQHYEQGSKNFDHARIDTIMKCCIALQCKLEDIIEDQSFIKLIKMLPK